MSTVWNPSFKVITKSILQRLKASSTRNKRISLKATEDTISTLFTFVVVVVVVLFVTNMFQIFFIALVTLYLTTY